MEEQKTKWLHTRLTPEEYDVLYKQFKATTCRKLSQYVRAKLFDQNITVFYRNQSLDDFMTALLLLRTELTKIGNNFNQAVKRLHTMKPDSYASPSAAAYEQSRLEVMLQVAQINEQLKKFSGIWLQSSVPDRH